MEMQGIARNAGPMRLALFTGTLFFGLLAAAQEHATPSPDKKASEFFKNVQVLKDIPSDQLIPGMQFITSSLGVQCEYCHVENAFDKDDKKPKQTARKMMQMMVAINANNFEGQEKISCYSCHRGSQVPVGIPIVADTRAYLENPEGPGAPVQGLPSANDILEKNVAA